jgi:hypothetical protein
VARLVIEFPDIEAARAAGRAIKRDSNHGYDFTVEG